MNIFKKVWDWLNRMGETGQIAKRDGYNPLPPNYTCPPPPPLPPLSAAQRRDRAEAIYYETLTVHLKDAPSYNPAAPPPEFVRLQTLGTGNK